MPRLYVGGIPSDCRERDIDKFFRKYGRISDVLMKNGYAFVVSSMNKHFDASKDGALSMSAPSFKNKKVFDGKLKVVVTYLLEHTDPMWNGL